MCSSVTQNLPQPTSPACPSVFLAGCPPSPMRLDLSAPASSGGAAASLAHSSFPQLPWQSIPPSLGFEGPQVPSGPPAEDEPAPHRHHTHTLHTLSMDGTTDTEAQSAFQQSQRLTMGSTAELARDTSAGQSLAPGHFPAAAGAAASAGWHPHRHHPTASVDTLAWSSTGSRLGLQQWGAGGGGTPLLEGETVVMVSQLPRWVAVTGDVNVSWCRILCNSAL